MYSIFSFFLSSERDRDRGGDRERKRRRSRSRDKDRDRGERKRDRRDRDRERRERGDRGERPDRLEYIKTDEGGEVRIKEEPVDGMMCCLFLKILLVHLMCCFF